MNSYLVNFTTKQGMTAKPSEKIKSIDIAGAKIIALKLMNSETYTVSIIDQKNKTAFHYGFTGVSLGQNKI